MPCITYDDDDKKLTASETAFKSFVCYVFSDNLGNHLDLDEVLEWLNPAKNTGFISETEKEYILSWWKEHVKKDREALEKKKKKALSKLTLEERKLLGL
jgi:hypothetical protein